jgi:hypothetical protein
MQKTGLPVSMGLYNDGGRDCGLWLNSEGRFYLTTRPNGQFYRMLPKAGEFKYV